MKTHITHVENSVFTISFESEGELDLAFIKDLMKKGKQLRLDSSNFNSSVGATHLQAEFYLEDRFMSKNEEQRILIK